MTFCFVTTQLYHIGTQLTQLANNSFISFHIFYFGHLFVNISSSVFSSYAYFLIFLEPFSSLFFRTHTFSPCIFGFAVVFPQSVIGWRILGEGVGIYWQVRHRLRVIQIHIPIEYGILIPDMVLIAGANDYLREKFVSESSTATGPHRTDLNVQLTGLRQGARYAGAQVAAVLTSQRIWRHNGSQTLL